MTERLLVQPFREDDFDQGGRTAARPSLPGRHVLACQESSCYLSWQELTCREGKPMDESVRTHEAAQSLAEVGARRREAALAQVWLPGWYFWAIGALLILVNLGMESQTPWLFGGALAGFAIGVPIAMVTAARRRSVRGQARFGWRGGMAIALLVVVSVGVALALAFGLEAALPAYRWPSTTGAAASAAVLVLGGPAMMRAVRRDVDARAGR
jgi:hypothetical protein